MRSYCITTKGTLRNAQELRRSNTQLHPITLNIISTRIVSSLVYLLTLYIYCSSY